MDFHPQKLIDQVIDISREVDECYSEKRPILFLPPPLPFITFVTTQLNTLSKRVGNGYFHRG